jgi:hypothetical protein
LIARIREILSTPPEKRAGRVVLIDHNPIEHFVGRDKLLTESRVEQASACNRGFSPGMEL